MTQPARLTEAESAVLDATLPAGLKPDMRDVALCLFEVLVFDAGGGGSAKPSADWLLQLQRLAKLALAQLDHLAQQKGGQNFYLGKNFVSELPVRQRTAAAAGAGMLSVSELPVRQRTGSYSRQPVDSEEQCGLGRAQTQNIVPLLTY